MKKTMISILMGGLLFSGLMVSSISTNKAVNAQFSIESISKTSNEELKVYAKSAYLMDFATQTPMYTLNEEAHLPIASMCKIMTLILVFDAMDAGEISLEEEICVSERAASMGGSQVFLEANAKYPVNELIKSIIVCSANDSCVALAEQIAGNEDIFVSKMNEKAKQLGANNTLFANCTGLPKDPQYSCAKDVAIMLKELLKHQEYYEYGKVWMDKFQHPKGRYTEITNTNKLVRFYDGCDGGKTGFTNEAGFCLAATAKRKEMRVISVVIGEETSKNRFEDVSTMFNYAFANYSSTPIFEAGQILEQQAKIEAGKSKSVAIYPEKTVQVLTKRGEKAEVSTTIELIKPRAPLPKGSQVGELVVYKDGIEMDRVALLTAEDVNKASFFDRLREVARAWNFRN